MAASAGRSLRSMERNSSGHRPKAVLFAVVGIARQNGISLTAAGVAFYVFNSLVPLLVFAVVGLSAVGWLGLMADILGLLTAVEADRIVSIIERVIGDGAGRLRAATLAFVVLAWSALTMTQSINVAFGEVYNARKRRSWAVTAANSAVAFVIILLVIPLFLASVVTLTALTDATVVRVVSVPLVCLALFVAFVPMYVRFPGEAVSIREALPGAGVAAVAWTFGAVGFRLYLDVSGSVQLYGVAGAVMLLLTWLYLGGLALLLGAILNAVLGGRVNVDDAWTPK